MYLLKQNEKTNDYKLKTTYYLNDLRSITKIDDKLRQTTSSGQQIVTDVYAFEFLFRSDNDENNSASASASEAASSSKYRFVWQCNKADERNDFLDTLWKLSEQFVKKNERPKFVNYVFESK